MQMLEPYVPTKTDPFDLRKSGHLLRRAAFGGSVAERQRLVKLGVGAAVSEMFDGSTGEDVDNAFEDVLALGGIQNVRSFRVWRLLKGRQRMRERMSFFWHDHFATSNLKVKNPRMMARQLAVFDRRGLGVFDDLLLAVSRDPAMVRWLDNETNTRGDANENFARELFELFALGEGNYTERDVSEAARAFTGWHIRGEEFAFKRFHHDVREKTVFGETGRLGGEDVIAMTVRREASARFLAKKLLAFFVHPEPSKAEITAVAALYGEKNRHVGNTLRVLLRSELFFSPRAYRSRVKSPADFAVGMVRGLGASASPKAIGQAMIRMGQSLLEPPDVSGWPEEREWLTSATWLMRSNFAARLFAKNFKVRPAAGQLLSQPSSEARADAALEMLVDGDVDAATRARIRTIAAKNPDPSNLLHAVQLLPEGQML